MNEMDSVKKILAPFVAHQICKDEADALRMLARNYVERQIQQYRERVENFRSFYQTSVDQFAKQVAALCQGLGEIKALSHFDRKEQILRAEDDLEEWQGAEQFLTRWEAVQAELRDASSA
jgi:transcriptional regulator of heat shock response